MSHGRKAVVDGSNVAHIQKTRAGKPRVHNLLAVRKTLQEKGYGPIIIVDAALRHDIDDPGHLESLIDSQAVRQAPAGTDADFFVIETADQQDGIVISNDRYEPYQQRYPWIRKRRLPLMIVEGRVELYEAVDRER